jgi:hypothetical protein
MRISEIAASRQQNVCAMVAGRQNIKYIYPTTFTHADSGCFKKPPLRKHKRCAQGGKVGSGDNDVFSLFGLVYRTNRKEK